MTVSKTKPAKEKPLEEEEKVLTLRERLGMLNNAKASPLLATTTNAAGAKAKQELAEDDDDQKFRKEVAQM